MNATTRGHCGPPGCSRRWVGVLAAAASSIALLATACGGSTGPASTAGASHPPGYHTAGASHPPGYQQYHAYSQCMRSHGAPFWPEPSERSHGVFDSPFIYRITARILARERGTAWQAAVAACRKVAPQGLPFTAAQITALRSDLDKLAACMRGHGITRFPSPVVNLSGGGFPSPGTGVKPDSARFRAAQRACWVYAPGSR